MAKRQKKRRETICGKPTSKHKAEMDAINLHRALFVDNKTIKIRRRGKRYQVCYKHFT